MVPRLHVLTSDDIAARPDFVPTAEAIIKTLGPHGAFHLRVRTLTSREHVALVQRLLAVARPAGTLLVVNERVDVALAGEADAVQLGRGALRTDEVRRIAPQLRVGTSVHAVAIAKQEKTADWILLGQVFPSASHPGAMGGGLELVRDVVSAAVQPVIAVGGIDPSHVAPILRLGAHGVAVISGIWFANDPIVAAARYLSRLWPQESPRGPLPLR